MRRYYQLIINNMDQYSLKNYKIATWILAIAVVILGALLINASKKDAASNIEDANAALQDCSTKLSDWRAAHPKNVLLTAGDRDALEILLQDCSASFGNADDVPQANKMK